MTDEKPDTEIHTDGGGRAVTDEMVNRFLCWRLPEDFSPDGGISFSKTVRTMEGERPRSEMGPAWWPIGTNLLSADQARSMLEHILKGTQ